MRVRVRVRVVERRGAHDLPRAEAAPHSRASASSLSSERSLKRRLQRVVDAAVGSERNGVGSPATFACGRVRGREER